MLKTFLATKSRTALLLEDDVVFKDLGPLEAAMDQLPAEWEVLYLGANLTDMVFGIKENPPVRYSANLFRVKRAWTTHAVAYSRVGAERIATVYNPYTCGMYDEFASSHMLEKMNAYCVAPMVAWQRKGKSDLWGKETDYTGAFEWGNKLFNDVG